MGALSNVNSGYLGDFFYDFKVLPVTLNGDFTFRPGFSRLLKKATLANFEVGGNGFYISFYLSAASWKLEV